MTGLDRLRADRSDESLTSARREIERLRAELADQEDNRISKIRDVLDAPRDPFDDGGEKLARIRAILDSAPPAPRVFLPHDRVPVDTVITGKGGSPFRVPDTYATDGLAGVGVPFVEVFVPSPDEWQALVDRATSERAIPEPTEGQNRG